MYIGLLADQEKEGCCGKLKERYYVLKATEKQETKNEFSFYAGKHCTEEILKLINVSPLPYFNPFKSIGDNVRGGTTNPSKSNKQKVNPTNKELINAIYVISMAWNYPPPISVLNIIDFTKKLDEKTVNKNGFLWINKNLSNDKDDRTLSQIYSDLKEQNPDMREIGFERLKDAMNEFYPDEVNRY